MPIRLEFRCRCGAIVGQASAASRDETNRVVCYCDDCQAFARFLGRADVVDPRGGTDLVQFAPNAVTLDDARGAMRAMRLSEKGLYRCYCGECRTPVGNMLAASWCPFVGVPMAFVATPDIDAVLGPAREKIMGRFAIGGCPVDAEPRASLGFLLRSARWLAGNALRQRHRGSPYFDAVTHAPRVTPRVLTPDDRDALRT